MGKWTPVDLPEGANADADASFTDECNVNYLVEYASAPSRSRVMLRGVPGLRPWADVGSGHWRGLRNVEGRRFGVCGNYLYEFNKTGTTANRLGYVGGIGRVSMSHNQIAGGYQVAVANGSAGYIYNTVTGVFQRITDDSFPGVNTVDFIDQMLVWVEAQGRYFLPSDIADGLTYTQLESQEAEAAPDKIQCAVVAHQELVVFGKRTVQFYQSTGDPEELFADKKSGIDVGAASPFCVSLLDNTLFFVDDKGRGCRLNGSTPERITTHAIEYAWSQCDLAKCFSFVWEDRGHAVWYVTFPDGMTWGYDCATQKWHRRQTIGLDRWRLNCLVQWDGIWYGGAYNSSILYALDWDYPWEGCDELVGEFTPALLHDNGNQLFLDGLRIEFDTGPTVECESVAPIDPIIHEYSNDQFFAVVSSLDTAKKSPTGQAWTSLTFPGTGNYCAANASAVVAAKTTGELYYSTDGGVTFTASASTFTNCRGITWDPASSRFVGMRDDAGTLKLFYSTDNGVTWTAGATVGVIGSGNAIRAGLGCVVLATSDGIYVSGDGGATCPRVIAGDWTALGFNGTGFLIGSNTGGTYEYSTAPQTTWTVKGGTTSNAPLVIVGSSGFFVVGTLEGGIWRTSNNGATLTKVVDSGERFYTGACTGGRVVIGSGNAIVGTVQYWSADGGQTFTQVTPNLADNDICVVPA